MKEKVKSHLNKISKRFKKFTNKGIIFLIIVGIGSLVFYIDKQSSKTITEVSNTVLEERLTALDDIVTSKFEYTGFKRIVDPIKVPVVNCNVPLTTHKIEVNYTGVIKVGYKTSEIKVSQEHRGEKYYIVIDLPEAYITDNYIDTANTKLYEEDNIFNPIEANEWQTAFDEIKQEELERAEKQGLYIQAEEQVKNILIKTYKNFEKYEVKFI